MKKKSLLIIACILTGIFSAGCSGIISKTDYVSVRGTILPETDYSPEETVQAALGYLKEADINSFNQYVCYPVKREGLIWSGYNIMYGNNIGEEEKVFIRNMTAGLMWEVQSVRGCEDSAEIELVVSKGVVSEELCISLMKQEGIWRIIVDERFREIVSGRLVKKRQHRAVVLNCIGKCSYAI